MDHLQAVGDATDPGEGKPKWRLEIKQATEGNKQQQQQRHKDQNPASGQKHTQLERQNIIMLGTKAIGSAQSPLPKNQCEDHEPIPLNRIGDGRKVSQQHLRCSKTQINQTIQGSGLGKRRASRWQRSGRRQCTKNTVTPPMVPIQLSKPSPGSDS